MLFSVIVRLFEKNSKIRIEIKTEIETQCNARSRNLIRENKKSIKNVNAVIFRFGKIYGIDSIRGYCSSTCFLSSFIFLIERLGVNEHILHVFLPSLLSI